MSSLPDLELGFSPTDRTAGYPAVAAFIDSDPDGEGFIFRKFRVLGARNLLCLQSELMELQQKLQKLDKEAANSRDRELQKSQRNWENLARKGQSQAQTSSESQSQAPEASRLQIILQIREKIKEYYDALLQQHQILNLGRPTPRVTRAFRGWLNGPNDKDPILGGVAKKFFDNELDLVALRAPEDEDMLSRFVQNNWPTTSASSPYDTAGHYPEKHVKRAVAIISVLVAAILLIGAIMSLYFIKEPGTRLGLIGGFTAFFALCISVLTNAQRAEIFAASAAYAAVLVVFVSGHLRAA